MKWEYGEGGLKRPDRSPTRGPRETGHLSGTEVEIHEEDGKAVVEPEDNPEQIIERMEKLVAATDSERGKTSPIDEGVDPIAKKHRDAVRRGADKYSDE